MAQYGMVCSVTYDDGSTLSKDHDGVLVISPDLYLLRAAPTGCRDPQKVVNSVFYYNGSTTAKDQDGQLAVDATTERLASGNLRLTYVLPRTLFYTPTYDDGSTESKDHDGVLVVDGNVLYPPTTAPSGKTPQPLVDTTSFYNGSTTSKDQDGELVLLGEPLSERTRTSQERYILAPSASVEGDATANSDSSEEINSASASVAGDATASGDNVVYRGMSASVAGTATAAAISSVTRHGTGSCDILFTMVGELSEVVDPGHLPVTVPVPLPGEVRSFYGEGISPHDSAVVAQRGDVSVNNRLVPNSVSSFSLSGGYSGPAYSLGGPFSATAPIKLGFRRGDRLKIWGQLGTEPNHGREFTFDNPDGFAVMEKLTLPDTNEYEFIAFRRLA